MAFKRPTLKELIEQTKNDFQKELVGFATDLRFQLSKVYAYVIAGCTHLLYGYLDHISKQAIPDTAEVENLRRWGIILGVYEKEPTFSEYDIEFTGVNGSIIPNGTTLVNPISKVEYQTIAEVTIAAGVAVVHVEALTEGKIGNLIVGDKLTLISPIVGVENQATVKETNFLNGQDKEDPEDYRARVIARLQNPPQGGSETDYKNWALEIAGVTRAWVYPAHLGLGTVGVSFVLDDAVDIVPNLAKIAEVQAYINVKKPVTAQVTVFAPLTLQVDLEIEIKPNTLEIRNAVTAELQDLFKRRSSPGGKIYLSEIREAISVAAGEDAHNLILPIADITPAVGTMPKLGVITWQTMP